MKKRKTQNTLYRLVLKEYFYLLVILCVLIFSFVEWQNNTIESYDTENNTEDLIQAILTCNEDYKSIQTNKYIRDGGYFEIVDETGQILYSSTPTKQTKYTKGALLCIPEFDSNGYIFDDTLNDETGKKRILYEFKEDEEDKHIFLHSILITDESGNVIYGSNPNSVNKISNEDLSYLYASKNQSEYLQKYAFNQQNKPHYIITHTVDQDYYALLSQMKRNRYIATTCCIIVVIITVALFGKRLNRKLKQPLTILEEGIHSFKDGSFEPIHYEGLKEIEDIATTFNEMSQKLNTSYQAQKQLEAQRAKMLADISHDLKTPITVIQGYSKALSDHVIDPNEQDKYLTTIYQKSTLMEELINAFYEYARLDHPNFELHKQQVNLLEFTRLYFAEKFNELELQQFELDINLPDKETLVSLDPFQIKRVYENIVSNSLKHNQPGTTIFVSYEETSTTASIQIGDNGSGISEDLKEKLFDPFIVGEQARTFGKGSGLGLSIAKKLMEAHNGTIELTEYKQGLTYKFTFPKDN